MAVMSSSSLTSPQKFGFNTHTFFGPSSSSLRDLRQGGNISSSLMLPHLKFRIRPPSWSDKKHPCPSSLARVFFYVHSTQSHTEISDRQLEVFHKNRLHTPMDGMNHMPPPQNFQIYFE